MPIMREQESELLRRPESHDEELGEQETDYRPFNWRTLFTWKMLPLWIIVVIVIVVSVLVAVDNSAIVAKLTPITQKIRAIPAGWLIPIAILILISFPPLFGHEIVAVLVGVVWGLWEGFGIVAAGTFFGELATWFVFMYALRSRALRLERTNLTYGALARLVRDGGFWIVLLVRFSVVPSHMSTAVFSTCGVKFWHFVVATFLSLPKQLIVVYMGTLISGQQSDRLVKALVFIVGGGITAAISWYIFRKLGVYKKILLGEQEKRRMRQAQELNPLDAADTSTSSVAAATAEQPGPAEYPWMPAKQRQWQVGEQYPYAPDEQYRYAADQQARWDSSAPAHTSSVPHTYQQIGAGRQDLGPPAEQSPYTPSTQPQPAWEGQPPAYHR